MSALPKDVQAAVEAANEIASKIQTEKPSDEAAFADLAQAPSEEPEGDKESGGEGAAPDGSGIPSSSQVGGGPSPSDPVELGSAEPTEDPNSATYKARWESLQGQHKSYQARIDEQQAQIDTLKSVIDKLSSKEEVEEPTAARPSFSPLTEQEVEEYGEDLIDVIKRAAREEVASELDTLRTENSELKQRLEGVGKDVEQQNRDAFFTALFKVVPDWGDLNSDQGFNAWLEQTDPYTGEPRRVLLSRALDVLDAQRVGQFFLGYKRERDAISTEHPAPSPTPTAEPLPTGAGRKVGLESMVAPGVGSSSGSDASSSGSQRPIKESEIHAFYDDVRRGAYRGRTAEQKAAEQAIQSAVNENRILIGQ